MRTFFCIFLVLGCTLAARADFSYTTTTKPTGGMAAGMAPQTSRHLYKSDKMKLDNGGTATIMDFGAQTMTHIDHTRKSYTVTAFSDIGAKAGQVGAEAKVDVKETGQTRVIKGYRSRQVVLTMETEAAQMRGPGAGMKMRITMDMWLSSDVPGASEARAFYQRTGNKMPWEAMFSGGDQSMARGMANAQRTITGMNGVVVLQAMKMESAGGNTAQQAQMQDAMAKMRAQMEAMKKAGGEQAKAAEKMQGMFGGGASAGGPLMEVIVESSDFSGGTVPAPEFEIPAGYQRVVDLKRDLPPQVNMPVPQRKTK